jgi:hypothetical protein
LRHPLLFLGLVGFRKDQRDLVEMMLSEGLGLSTISSEPSHPSWLVGDLHEANALLLNGPHCRVDAGGLLHLEQHENGHESLALDLNETTMPLAMAEPVPDKLARNPYPRVKLDHSATVRHMLRQFEAALRERRCMYALGRMLLERRGELNAAKVYHLMRMNTLDVIVDMPHRRVMLRPGLRPIDMEDQTWLQRPPMANNIPPGFSVWTIEEVAWVLSMHRTQIELPERYQRKTIHYRRMPRARPTLMYPRHMRLLHNLADRPKSLSELMQESELVQSGDDQQRLLRDIYGLYLCRAISTVKPERPVQQLPRPRVSEAADPDSTPFTQDHTGGFAPSSIYKVVHTHSDLMPLIEDPEATIPAKLNK